MSSGDSRFRDRHYFQIAITANLEMKQLVWSAERNNTPTLHWRWLTLALVGNLPNGKVSVSIAVLDIWKLPDPSYLNVNLMKTVWSITFEGESKIKWARTVIRRCITRDGIVNTGQAAVAAEKWFLLLVIVVIKNCFVLKTLNIESRFILLLSVGRIPGYVPLSMSWSNSSQISARTTISARTMDMATWGGGIFASVHSHYKCTRKIESRSQKAEK